MKGQALRTFADVDAAAALLITKTVPKIASFIERRAVLLATVAST
jgi:hypothetical protein